MNRVIPDFSKDKRVNLLSPFAEIVFRRLWNKADDYGCYYADPLILKAELFPRREIRTPDLTRSLRDCEEAGLLVQYTSPDGEQYLKINDFNQRVRAAKSKFPQPSGICRSNDGQMSGRCRLEEEEEEEKKKKGGGKPPDFDFFSLLPEPFGESEQFRGVWNAWLRYRRERKLAKWTETTLRTKAKQFAEWGVNSTIAAINASIAQGWQGIFPEKKPPSASSEISVETFRRAYNWLTHVADVDYPSERDKAVYGASIDELRTTYKTEYDDVCRRLKDPFDAMTKFVRGGRR